MYGSDENGVINTKNWLDQHFFDPSEIFKLLLSEKSADIYQAEVKQVRQSEHKKKSKKVPNPLHFYKYLQRFGMYSPSRQSHQIYNELKKKDVWSTVQQSFTKYKQKWNGPDIPIYIFPFSNQSSLFARPSNKKSGVSFHDKLFLFLTPNLNETEIEALLVHEYHHVCRLNHIDKTIEEYTLLDSIILEGLAEAMVEENCGKHCLATWCSQYSDNQLQQYWKKYLKNNLALKKDQPQHEHLLFGGRGVPNMLGYAVGYQIVQTYKKTNYLTDSESFTIDAHDFLYGKFSEGDNATDND